MATQSLKEAACVMCFQLSCDLIKLPCTHAVCTRCLTVSTAPKTALRCPACGVESMLDDFDLSGLPRSYNLKRSLVADKDKEDEGVEENRKIFKCSEHDSDAEPLFCSNCSTVVSAKCVLRDTTHRLHEILKLDEGERVMKVRYESILRTLAEVNTAAETQIERVKSNAVDTVRTINEQIDEMVSNLEALRLKLVTEVERAAQLVISGTDLNQDDHRSESVRLSKRISEIACLGSFHEMVVNWVEVTRECSRLEKLHSVQLPSHSGSSEPAVGVAIAECLDELRKLREHVHEVTEHVEEHQSNTLAENIKSNAHEDVHWTDWLMCIGGDPGDKQTVVYNVASNEWHCLAETCAGREHAAASAWDNGVLVAGGYPRMNLVEKYNPCTNLWTPFKSLRVGRHSHALLNAADNLFAVGGSTGVADLSSVERYDSSTDDWLPASPLNSARHSMAAAAITPHRIIVAGGHNKTLGTLASCESFDVLTNSWSVIASLNKARKLAAAASHASRMYIFGGADDNCSYDDVECYSALADQWTVLQVRMSSGRSELASACVSGRIYLIGGLNDKCDLVKTNECFDPETEQICTVAPLARPCTALAAALLRAPVESIIRISVDGDD